MPDDRTLNAGVGVQTADGSRRPADAADVDSMLETFQIQSDLSKWYLLSGQLA